MAVTVNAQFSKRFRRPRTYSYWGDRDGLFLGHKSQMHTPMHWHFFKDGDVVEFKDPSTGKLCRRQVMIEYDHHFESDYGHAVRCVDSRAYVRVGRKKTRVTEAPIMRLIEEA